VTERLDRWGGRISIAAINGPSSTVVSGEVGALGELLAELVGSDVRAKKIEVDYASHSGQVEQLADRLADVLAPISPCSSEIPFFSTVTGEWLDTADKTVLSGTRRHAC
jgi:polyene macrolide polyketide synthase, A-type KR domains